jgi:hypothetical protein
VSYWAGPSYLAQSDG